MLKKIPSLHHYIEEEKGGEWPFNQNGNTFRLSTESGSEKTFLTALCISFVITKYVKAGANGKLAKKGMVYFEKKKVLCQLVDIQGGWRFG